MYNEALKLQFINDDVTNKNYENFMPRIFESISKYEEEYGKDLCNFNIQEIENYFVGLSTSSFLRCQNIKSQFIKYCQYCQDRNLIEDNQIHWQEVDSKFLKNILNMGKLKNQFVTREQLLKDLSQLNNACEIFIVLGIFEGLCGNLYSDFYHLGLDAFSKKKNKYYINLPTRSFSISDELYNLAVESSEQYERIPHSLDAKRNLKLNKDDPYIIKRTANSYTDSLTANMHLISKSIARIKNDYDMPYCTQAALMNSGRLYYLHELSENGKYNAEEILKKYHDAIFERFGRIQVLSDIIEQYNNTYGGDKK